MSMVMDESLMVPRLTILHAIGAVPDSQVALLCSLTCTVLYFAMVVPSPRADHDLDHHNPPPPSGHKNTNGQVKGIN